MIKQHTQGGQFGRSRRPQNQNRGKKPMFLNPDFMKPIEEPIVAQNGQRAQNRSHGSTNKHSSHSGSSSNKSNLGGTSSNRQSNLGGPVSSRDNIRIIPIGGVEEVGRNMTLIEYKDDIVLIDAGLQFPEEGTPGIDYIIPNVKYLEKKLAKVRGLIISHGHLDHVGAIPYLIKDIGNPPIYTTGVTSAMIEKRQEEFPNMPKLNIKQVQAGDKIQLGKDLTARFFNISHTIPDAIGIIIGTDKGNVIYPGDFKIDRDINGVPLHIDEFEEIGKENNLVLLLESTNSEKPGFSISEATARENIKKIFEGAQGRIIMGTFSSLLERIIEAVTVAEELGRKVFIDGYSMKSNMEIMQSLGFFKPKKGTILPVEKINSYPANKVLAVCTGAQGEENAVLMRIANKKHKHIKIQPHDTIILSSSIVPGNESAVQILKDNLARQGAKIVHSGIMDVHATGHANQEELKMMMTLIKPKFLVPIHGNYFMLRNNSELAISVGIPEKNILVPMNNGAIIEVNKEKIDVLRESAPSDYVMVDGLGVGDVKEIVIRDRQLLAQDGMFVIVAVVDRRTKKIIGNPQVTSRGFIYVKENFDLVNTTKKVVEKVIKENTAPDMETNWDFVKNQMREAAGNYLFQKTKRRPMVLPVVIEV